MGLIVIIVSSSLVSNIVLSRFLGICPFLGVSNNVKVARGMGLAVIFVIMISTVITYYVNEFFLIKEGIFGIDLTYLQTIVFILIIATLVQFVEMFLKKYIKVLYDALGVYLPLITTNCAVLGTTLTVVDKNLYSDIYYALSYAFGTSLGFLIAILLLSSIREKIENNDIIESFKGRPIVLIIAGIMAIVFQCFSNLNIGG